MTFEQFLEGKRIWNTRNPQYDINLAGDYSDDSNDASHFLIPFMKKIKAFYWWLRVAGNDLTQDFHRWNPEDSRHQGIPGYKYSSRVAALHNMVGYSTSGEYDHPNRGHIHRLGSYMEQLYFCLARAMRGEEVRNIESTLKVVLESLQELLNFDGLPAVMKTKLERMLNLLNRSKDQLSRVMQFKMPGKSVKNLDGENIDM